MLMQMNIQKQVKGDGLFFAVNDQFFLDILTKKRRVLHRQSHQELNYCFGSFPKQLKEYCTYPEFLKPIDKELEEGIRLCDTIEYLDTWTVSSELLEDGERFLKLMVKTSRGKFLQSPCKGK